MLHDEARRRRDETSDEVERQRWDAIARKTGESLEWMRGEKDEN